MKKLITTISLMLLYFGAIAFHANTGHAEDPLVACDASSNDFDGDGVLNDVDFNRADSCLLDPDSTGDATCTDDTSTSGINEAGRGDGNPECDDAGIPYPDEE